MMIQCYRSQDGSSSSIKHFNLTNQTNLGDLLSQTILYPKFIFEEFSLKLKIKWLFRVLSALQLYPKHDKIFMITKVVEFFCCYELQ